MQLRKNNTGAITLIITLIVAVIASIIAISLGVSSIAGNQMSLYQQQSKKTFLNTDGCAEEALTKLNRNNVYTGETLTVDGTSCVITIMGAGSTRTVTITGTKTNYIRTIRINVTLFPTFRVINWGELTV